MDSSFSSGSVIEKPRGEEKCPRRGVHDSDIDFCAMPPPKNGDDLHAIQIDG